MPIELSTALLSLAGVLTSALVGYGVAERKLSAERRLDRRLDSIIRDLLEVAETPARRFSTICRHLKGLTEDEIRRALIQSGAIALETEDGEECWGLTYRIKNAIKPAAEDPFSFTGTRYSITANSLPSPKEMVLERLQMICNAGIVVDAEAKTDFVEFWDVEYSCDSDLGERVLPDLSVSDNGTIKAKWQSRFDDDDDQLEIEFHGGGVVRFRRVQISSGKRIREWSGTDTSSGVCRILATARPSPSFR